MLRISAVCNVIKSQKRHFFTGRSTKGADKNTNIESERIKQFHEKLKLEPAPRSKKEGRSRPFLDHVLVTIDPRTGELISNSEKNPTKWGDWQHGGRVTDF